MAQNGFSNTDGDRSILDDLVARVKSHRPKGQSQPPAKFHLASGVVVRVGAVGVTSSELVAFAEADTLYRIRGTKSDGKTQLCRVTVAEVTVMINDMQGAKLLQLYVPRKSG